METGQSRSPENKSVKIRSLRPATDQSHCWVSASSYSKELPSSESHRWSRNFLALNKQSFVAAAVHATRSQHWRHTSKTAFSRSSRQEPFSSTLLLPMTHLAHCPVCEVVQMYGTLVCPIGWTAIKEQSFQGSQWELMGISTNLWRLQKNGLP